MGVRRPSDNLSGRSELEKEVMCVFNRADVDGNRNITLREWLDVFRAIDRNGDACISRKEWHSANGTAEMYDRISSSVKGSLNMRAWQQAFTVLDVDGSGTISMREWLDAHDRNRGCKGNVAGPFPTSATGDCAARGMNYGICSPKEKAPASGRSPGMQPPKQAQGPQPCREDSQAGPSAKGLFATPRRQVRFGEATVHHIDRKLPAETHVSEAGVPQPASPLKPPCVPATSQFKAKVSPSIRGLQKTLVNYQFLARNVKDDSACLFRAVADQLFNNQESHRQVRQKAIEQLRSNPSQYADSVNGRSWRQYLAQLVEERTRGDSTSLQALADAYNVQVLVLASFAGNKEIRVHPSGNPSAAREIYLGLVRQDKQEFYTSLKKDVSDIVGLR